MSERLTFSTIDYGIFITMMSFSVLIGLYYGFFAMKKQNTTSEFLLGSKTLKVWPVAIFLTATHISSNTIIGVPSEMYKFGIQYWFSIFSSLMVTLSLNYIYLPVFHELNIISCYEYLEKRFDHRVQKIASFCFFVFVVSVSPLFVYGPGLAFSQVTGMNLHIITPIICAVCVFYTTFGGLRAVVWNDTIQFSAMIFAVLVIMGLGTYHMGGIYNVFEIAEKGGRLVWFNFDPDPSLRNSFWTISIGLTTMWISNVGVTPECIQRLVAIPSLADAQKAVWIFGVGHTSVKLAAVYCGLLIYSQYSTCDPVFNGDVEKYDQMFPYYVMDIGKSIPGLSGLFIVGILSAALSSMSSCLNSLAGTMYQDFLRPLFPNATEEQASTTMKFLVFLIGCICLGLVFVVEKLGSVFSISIAFTGSTYGTLLGLFTMGMLCPKFNKHGAFWGSIISILGLGTMVLGAQIYIFNGQLRYPSLPFDVGSCFNNTFPNETYHIVDYDADISSVPWFFRINFMYYTLIGMFVFTLVGYVVSCFTGGNKNLDKRLLCPLIRKFYKNEYDEPNTEKAQEMQVYRFEKIENL